MGYLWSCVVIVAVLPLAGQIRPVDLKCEYRVDPLGIDVAAPRLSWILASSDSKTRGVKQSAYRILVASSSRKLALGQGDLWDTGEVKSAQSIHVEYAGKTLGSGTIAFWEVQIWDQNRKRSPWSTQSLWSMGLLRQEDWKAKWIGLDEKGLFKSPNSPYRHLKNARWIWSSGDGLPVFTKGFLIPAEREIASALCVMGADPGFELTLNDRLIARGTKVRSPEVLEIARFLKPGENRISVKASSSGKVTAGLIGVFRIVFRHGDPLMLSTDSTWSGQDASVRDLGQYGVAPWGEVGYTEERALPARMLRKEFVAKGGVKRATAYVSGMGLFEMYVNGSKIGDHVLSPNLTDYGKTIYYVTFDVTKNVTAGKNVVGLILGNGRYWAPREKVPIGMKNFGYPKARAQLEIEYADGTTARVVSDGTWKVTTDGPIRANNEYDGEEYDARKEFPGWDRPGFNDSNWRPVELVQAPAGRMAAQMAEPLRVTQTLKPVKATPLRNGVYVFDMGQNMVGWCRLRMRGVKGTQVRLRFAETLRDDGELYIDNLRSARATDLYTLKGGEPEEWEPRFTYHGFRFIEVQGFPGQPTVEAVEGRVVHDAMSKVADFVSSNPLLNQIHSNIYWGVRGNYRSIPTDCPQRDERQGWLGDRSVVSRSESYLFDVAAFYTKWETDLVDSQRPSGSIPDVSPAYWTMYNDDVTWPSTFIQIPSMLYDQYGDIRVIERNYGSMKKWIDHMRGFLEDGLMTKDTYGDWCVPPEDPKLIHSQDPARQTDGKLLATAYYYWMVRQMSRFARLIGKEPEAVEYDGLGAQIKTAFNKRFFNPGAGVYGNGTQTSGILPLSFGMTSDENRKSVLDGLIHKIQLESNGHVGTGLVGAQWLMRTLSENGRIDVAYQIATQKSYPGWGYMVSKGATTIWELWNGDTADPAMNSGNHVMQIGDLGLWMYEYLGGIRPDPDNPGFKHIRVRPYMVNGLTFVNASHKSMYGLISSRWRREGGTTTLDITIPANTSATVWFPAAKSSDVREGITAAEKARGIRFLRLEDGSVVFEVESGSYSFRSIT